MKFLTHAEANSWIDGRGLSRPEPGSEIGQVTLPYPKEGYRYFAIASALCNYLGAADEYLLLLTETGIWSSSENLHLYYRVRQSYGDQRLYHEAPGHLFLKHEQADLVTFFQLAMLNGWGGYVISSGENNSIFFSHDEFFIFYSENPDRIKQVAHYFRL